MKISGHSRLVPGDYLDDPEMHAEYDEARRAIETPRYSAFAKRHFAEGEAQGEVIGERHTIRMVLKARGLALNEDQSGQIETCDDLATLKEWSEAALTAKDADDIFR